MKKGLFFIAIVLMSCASVHAQAQGDINCRETVYGYRYESQNLRFVSPNKTSTEVEFGAITSGGDGDGAYGAVVAARYLHSNGSAIGLQADVTTPDGQQTLAGADVVAGRRFGKKSVTFEIDALAGYGQALQHQHSSSVDGTYSHDYVLNDWGAEVGAQVRLGFRLSSAWSLALQGGFKHNFVQKGEVELPEDWRLEKQTVDANRWFAALVLAYKTGIEDQWSGDHCLELAISGGTSNQGAVFGAEVMKFHRTSFNGGSIVGVSSEYLSKDGQTLNRLLAKGGYRFLPKGATSLITIDLTGAVGLGQVMVQANGNTEGAEVRTSLDGPSFGWIGKAQLGVNLHLRHVQIGAFGFAGYDRAFNVDYSGDLNYSGKTLEKGGSYCGFGARFSYAF